MLVIRNLQGASHVRIPELRQLIEQRFADLCNGDEYDEDLHGFLFVIEPGDCLDDIEAECGCPVLGSPFDNVRYGDAGFSPAFEVLEEHGCCFEMVFVPGDGDFGIVIFIPKTDGIDADLVAFCQKYATPAPEAP